MIRFPHVAMEFKKLSIPQKLVFGANIITMLGAAGEGTFETPDVPVATLLTLNNNLSETAAAAAGGDHQKVAAMHAAEKAWDNAFAAEALYVDRIANGNESIILLSGFKPTKSQTAPATVPGTVQGLKVTVNPLNGSIHIEVDPIQGAGSYLYFVSTSSTAITFSNSQFSIGDNPTVVAFIADTHRKVDFYNLPTAANLYVTVVAQNTAGIGAQTPSVTIKTL